ncbi:pro-resilin-like [Metopolophium dirhodum]|uniref:pro-resilin-like n=1 Tax=Metopolophium dirhodum TaxID=44670 RepID=UPI00298FA0B6|nr:pro-resilin-like [Metopolophium dirhodum]
MMLVKEGLFCFILFTWILLIQGRPQGDSMTKTSEKPEPYEYQYKVEDKPSGNYYGQNEVGKDTGRIEGSYFVYLPDGRLMTVTYYVDGESGFVPKITFQDNASPFGNTESNSIQRR